MLKKHKTKSRLPAYAPLPRLREAMPCLIRTPPCRAELKEEAAAACKEERQEADSTSDQQREAFGRKAQKNLFGEVGDEQCAGYGEIREQPEEEKERKDSAASAVARVMRRRRGRARGGGLHGVWPSLLRCGAAKVRSEVRRTRQQAPLVEDVLKLVRDNFVLYEHKDRRGVIDARDVPFLIRAMGLNPTEKQVQFAMKEMGWQEDASQTNQTAGAKQHFPIENFEKAMLEVLTLKHPEFVRPSEETLLRAFRALDKEDNGYIEPEAFKEIMTTKGEIFSPEEMEAALSVAADKDTGVIYYEDYAALLAQDGRIETEKKDGPEKA
ncbi:hypothetical protein CBR_g23763 [Chara braunii]|uniref:EF-hand domain-containing protein n=1 Tax=Chara braunii TaxID=69332 RepID=A0A388JVL4_CHABU|nr:hypothetical protein CBR_g23763 [Chara braunii]|eukprot:GBG61803.1 hypothetical protein CBR_g23763 [Chara braunii]